MIESAGTSSQRSSLVGPLKLALGVALAATLVSAGGALAAASYSDRAGDDNAAPDLTSLKVAETTGTLAITVTVANFETLPADSWVNVWFDLDSNSATGSDGDEALVRYSADGTLELFVWDGGQLSERPTAELTGTFSAGTLALAVPRVALGATSPSFGILAVGARGQTIGQEDLIAADFLPEDGRSPFAGAEVTFPDATGDHDAAPDITGIRVVDGKDGWIHFALTTPNYPSLRDDSLVGLFVDTDNRSATGDAGAEVRITSFGGEHFLERWQSTRRRWALDEDGTRVRVQSGGGVARFDVHRTELGGGARFGFAFVAGKVNVSTETLAAVDFAPEGDAYFHYALVNRPALQLAAGKTATAPLRPVAGKRVTVSARITRSDTGAVVLWGRVSCRVAVDGAGIRATGRFASRRAGCTFALPAAARNVRGSITIRSAGATVVVPFSFRVG